MTDSLNKINCDICHLTGAVISIYYEESVSGIVNDCRNMIRDFFLGVIKIHILYHATQEPVYGLDLIRELATHGYELSPGTLYPMLHRMEELGYLVSRKEVVAGKVRRYYTATSTGENALAQAHRQALELLREIGPDRATSS